MLTMGKRDGTRIIGESAVMQDVFGLAKLVAPTKATVLLTGETGSGKDVIAEGIYKASPRRDEHFRAVNCSGFSEELLQSQIFGHEKGAFTGATHQKRGEFELVDGGTLFLDEVAEMSLEVQVQFLRVLENQEIQRLGGEKIINVDVRIIAATNADLEQLIRRKQFRSDLYYRLNVFPIWIPPLRDRREDIPEFVKEFIAQLSRECGKPVSGITQEALDYLKNRDWRGNVRELRNAIQTAIIVSTTETGELQLEDFKNCENTTESIESENTAEPTDSEIHALIEALKRIDITEKTLTGDNDYNSNYKTLWPTLAAYIYGYVSQAALDKDPRYSSFGRLRYFVGRVNEITTGTTDKPYTLAKFRDALQGLLDIDRDRQEKTRKAGDTNDTE